MVKLVIYNGTDLLQQCTVLAYIEIQYHTLYTINQFEDISAGLTVWISKAACSRLADRTGQHEDEKVTRSTILVQSHATPVTDRQPQAFIKYKVDHRF